MINTSIRQFETQLYDLVNGVPLPNEVKRIVIENVMLKLTTAADNDIKTELQSAQTNNPVKTAEDVSGMKGEAK